MPVFYLIVSVQLHTKKLCKLLAQLQKINLTLWELKVTTRFSLSATWVFSFKVNSYFLRYFSRVFSTQRCLNKFHDPEAMVVIDQMKYPTKKKPTYASGEYWMIHRGPGFLAVEWRATPLSPVSKLDWRHTGRHRKRDGLLTGGGGAKSYDGEKASSSTNQSILSGSGIS